MNVFWMSLKPRRPLGQQGFTLVELMISVAIVVILATIGRAAFTQMAGKSKQAEAKTQLAAVYAGQKSFYAQWEQYYADFRDIGYTPEGQLNYRIRTEGSTSSIGLPGDYDFLGGACTSASSCANVRPVQFITFQYCGASGKCREVPSRIAALSSGTVINPSQTQFRAGAASNLDDDPKADEWTIDQDKKLVHRSDDLE